MKSKSEWPREPRVGDRVTVVGAHRGWGDGLTGVIRKIDPTQDKEVFYYLTYDAPIGDTPGPNQNFPTMNDLHYFQSELQLDEFLTACEEAIKGTSL